MSDQIRTDRLAVNWIIVATTEQISCELDGEAAILSFKDGVYYGLDEVGASVWNLIQQPRKVSEIRGALVDQYEVDAPRCERDLIALLSELLDCGLIEIGNGSAG
jgi:Coenzyme PQQ synthesis protein D (PqqD)